ncbi:MAG: DUF5058 family protein [Ruminococcaceae bacterium]|nr:DUF5058 family protein [Oscillospiraceae bacterium]
MEFSANHPILFVMVGIIIAVVLAQSVYFLLRAMKRAKELGITKKTVTSTITSSAIFTIAPAVAILLGVIVLSRDLGLAVPWLRLSVIGSLSYETIAAKNTTNALAEGISALTDAPAFVAVIWVMTISIAVGLIFVPLLTKKIQGGIIKMGTKDKKWTDVFSNAMFLGMISAFVGYVFCDVSLAFKGDFSGLIPVIVMFASALVMICLGLIATTYKIRWLTDYALPISLIYGMAIAIPVTRLLALRKGLII